jgi:hypothetical protein
MSKPKVVERSTKVVAEVDRFTDPDGLVTVTIRVREEQLLGLRKMMIKAIGKIVSYEERPDSWENS